MVKYKYRKYYNDEYIDKIHDICNTIKVDEYYVKKAIQKAIESYRIKNKEELRKLKK